MVPMDGADDAPCIMRFRARGKPLAGRAEERRVFVAPLGDAPSCGYASPMVSNIAALMASLAVLPAQTTNWNAV